MAVISPVYCVVVPRKHTLVINSKNKNENEDCRRRVHSSIQTFSGSIFFQKLIKRPPPRLFGTREYFVIINPSSWLKKFLKIDILKGSRMAQFYYFLSTIPSSWLKKFLRFDILKSSKMV